MSMPGDRADPVQSESSPDEDAEEMPQSNAAWRVEIWRLHRQNLELSRQLAEARTARQSDREARRAALNLMEDAVEAHHAEQREIAERRRAEAALCEADRHKDEFLAILAHELRNPLALIRNSLHILRTQVNPDVTSEPVCAMLDRQVNKMVRLVDELIDLSRIRQGLMELRKEATDLATIIGSAVESIRPLIEASEHQLTITLSSARIPLYGDALRLGQVFTNLLNNAAKYTDRRGRIWLTARQEGNEVVVSVRDTGVGLSEAMLPRIFDWYTQADRSSDRSRGGLGIGLTLVKKLVEMHGGTVSAHSEGPGRGTEFTVRLPLGVAPQAARSSPADRAEPEHSAAPDPGGR
jgi:signal transduction histidine kinase